MSVSLNPARPSRVPRTEPPPAFPVLAGIDEHALDVLEQCPILDLPVGTTLLAPGEIARSAFLLVEGRLRVHVGSLEDDPVGEIVPCGVVGEVGVLDGRLRSAFVVASEPSRLIEIPAPIFWKLIKCSHAFSVNLLSVLCARMRTNNATILESRRLQELYERRASVDALTGLHNRRWMDEVLPRMIKRAEHENEPLTVLMIDVDHFKKLNDNFGHPAGDFVLFAVAEVLKDRLRPTDLVARYGGEEFIVMLPRTGGSGALAAAERLRSAVAALSLSTGEGRQLPRVTVSIGAAALEPGEAESTLLARADNALYMAKNAGRDRTELAR